MRTFKTLYKTGSTGKLCQWSIRVEGATISEEWGQVGGKLQSTSDTIKEGKNLGRANATTAEQQAEAEAQSKWNKKMKGEYTDKLADAKKGKSSKMVKGGILPMLAHRYSQRAHNIVWPCFISPKLDGHRMTSDAAKEDVQLWTRQRNIYMACPHVNKAIEAMWKRTGAVPAVLDGEGYNEGYSDKFEELTHFLKQTKYIPGSEIIQFHIFDVAIPDMPFEQRYELIRKLLDKEPKDSPLMLVDVIEVNNEEEAMDAFEQFLARGYEGAVLRNKQGLYVNKRSNDLQKIKEFDDDEFLVTGVVEGRGKLQGHAMFRCQCKGGEFECKLKGKQEELKQYWEDPSLVVGKKLTVQYQGLTAKGMPRFAVGLRLCEKL